MSKFNIHIFLGVPGMTTVAESGMALIDDLEHAWNYRMSYIQIMSLIFSHKNS